MTGLGRSRSSITVLKLAPIAFGHLAAKVHGECGRLADRAIRVEEAFPEAAQRGAALEQGGVRVFDLRKEKPMRTGVPPFAGGKERRERDQRFLAAGFRDHAP
jgi:hypothetical protein